MAVAVATVLVVVVVLAVVVALVVAVAVARRPKAAAEIVATEPVELLKLIQPPSTGPPQAPPP